MPRPPKPGGAVFVPRSFVANPKKFGRSGTRLAGNDVIASPHQGAAELQHAIANRVREYLLDENTTLRAYCERNRLAAGLTHERFERILRGETMLTLTDLMFWATEIPDFADFIGTTLSALVAGASDVHSEDQ